MVIYDNYGRPALSLRIQVNTTCNFKCFFCHMEGTSINGSEMSPEAIERVIKAAHDLGVNKVKFTGGEPTLRRDIVEIIKRTRDHITGDISMTTNGVMLPKLAKQLHDAGLNRVNISMHSPDDDTFHFITGTEFLPIVKKAVDSANDAGLVPVKINFVVLKGVNVNQIPEMISLAAEKHAILQLIEFETTRENEDSYEYRTYHMGLGDIEDQIRKRSISVKHNELHNRPEYEIPTDLGNVIIEIVRPMRNPDFCAHCTRLRLTADGNFKTCLMRSDNSVYIGNIREDADLKTAFVKAVKRREPYWKPGDEIDENDEVPDIFNDTVSTSADNKSIRIK
ncbi:MAG: GTP 3',8-cyclase MoaA [Thermoplasmata archaeon]